MTYDEVLATRIRELVVDELDVTEKRMFGGLTFLVGGSMSVTVSRRGTLMVRLDPEDAEALIDGTTVVPFEMRGRPLKGWLSVDESRYATEEQLRDWVDRSVDFARTLPG